MVTLAIGVAEAVVIEAGLSWLGLGVPAPAASWGGMLRSAYDQMRSAPYLVYPPCVAIFLSVLAYHLAGGWLRRRLDPLAVS
jgi:peptide/nickel transport system permease protein